MKIFRFKFDQNHTNNEEFNFFKGRGGEWRRRGPPFLNLNLNYYWLTYEMKILFLKFHQNRTINGEFNFFEGVGEGPPGGKRTPIHKFQFQLLLAKI